MVGRLRDKLDPNRPVHADTKLGKNGRWYWVARDAETGEFAGMGHPRGYDSQVAAGDVVCSYLNVALLDGAVPERS